MEQNQIGPKKVLGSGALSIEVLERPERRRMIQLLSSLIMICFAQISESPSRGIMNSIQVNTTILNHKINDHSARNALPLHPIHFSVTGKPAVVEIDIEGVPFKFVGWDGHSLYPIEGTHDFIMKDPPNEGPPFIGDRESGSNFYAGCLNGALILAWLVSVPVLIYLKQWTTLGLVLALGVLAFGAITWVVFRGGGER